MITLFMCVSVECLYAVNCDVSFKVLSVVIQLNKRSEIITILMTCVPFMILRFVYNLDHTHRTMN